MTAQSLLRLLNDTHTRTHVGTQGRLTEPILMKVFIGRGNVRQREDLETPTKIKCAYIPQSHLFIAPLHFFGFPLLSFTSSQLLIFFLSPSPLSVSNTCFVFCLSSFPPIFFYQILLFLLLAQQRDTVDVGPAHFCCMACQVMTNDSVLHCAERSFALLLTFVGRNDSSITVW